MLDRSCLSALIYFREAFSIAIPYSQGMQSSAQRRRYPGAAALDDLGDRAAVFVERVPTVGLSD